MSNQLVGLGYLAGAAMWFCLALRDFNSGKRGYGLAGAILCAIWLLGAFVWFIAV